MPVPGGFVGVDVFFVISGFVITRMLLREIDNTGRISLTSFYGRRVRRLLPALAVMIVVVMLGALVIENPLGSDQIAAGTGAAASMFIANGVLMHEPDGYFFDRLGLNPFLHTWSLAVEEQFYLAFPLILLFAAAIALRRNENRRLWTIIVVAAVSLVSIVLAFYLIDASGPPLYERNATLAFYSSPTRAWEFGVGALVAAAETQIARLHRGYALAFAVVGSVGVVAGATLIDGTRPYPNPAALLPVLGCGLLIAAGTVPGRQLVATALSTRPMVWIGALSYSWYLWHWPLMIFSRFLIENPSRWVLLVFGIGALIPAWLSKRYVEDPIRLRRLFGNVGALRIATACIVVPLVVCVASYGVAKIATPKVRDVRAQREHHLDYQMDCRDVHATDPVALRRCEIPSSSAIDGRAVVLIGDSDAGQLAEAVVPAARNLNRPTVLAIKWGCPFVDLVLETTPPDCYASGRNWLDQLVAARPGLVIISSASDYYMTIDPSIGYRLPDDAHFTRDLSEKGELWRKGIASTLRTLSAAGVPVLLVNPLTHFFHWDVARCPGVTVWTDVQRCGATLPLPEMQERQRVAREAERAAAAGVPNVSTVDFVPQMCADGVCRTNEGSTWINVDDLHITVGAAERLEPDFTKLIAAQARQ